MIRAPNPSERMCSTPSLLSMKETGSGKCANSLKAFRRRMRERISNCLPTEREKEQGRVKTRLITSRIRTTVKAA